jgi:hypothetical protein
MIGNSIDILNFEFLVEADTNSHSFSDNYLISRVKLSSEEEPANYLTYNFTLLVRMY